MTTFKEQQEDLRKEKEVAMKIQRIRDNEKGFDIPIPLSEWVNNSIFVDASEGKYTNLGDW